MHGASLAEPGLEQDCCVGGEEGESRGVVPWRDLARERKNVSLIVRKRQGGGAKAHLGGQKLIVDGEDDVPRDSSFVESERYPSWSSLGPVFVAELLEQVGENGCSVRGGQRESER